MSTITTEELKKIVELVKTVPEEYRQKCFELLLSHALQVISPPPPVVSPVTTGPAPTPTLVPKLFVLPIDVKAFLSQYGLDESLLWKFFLVEETEIRPIYKLETTKKATAQIQHALMMALETAISTGQFQVDIESLRARCKEVKCYYSANFMSYIKKHKNLFKTIEPDQPLSLSPDGKSELADLLEQLKD